MNIDKSWLLWMQILYFGTCRQEMQYIRGAVSVAAAYWEHESPSSEQ